MSIPGPSCIIVGAGICGLVAGRKLWEAGWSSTIVERNSAAGGRAATIHFMRSNKREEEWASFDTGAQFFTVRDSRFQKMVDLWLEDGAAVEWSRGFAVGDGSYYQDGHPRYRGHPNMAALALYLSNGLDIRFNHHVKAVELIDGAWSVRFSDNTSFACSSLILTLPVPQSLELLAISSFKLPPDLQKALEKITYDPCLALMVQLDGNGILPDPGGLWPVSSPIDWIADNFRKQVSPLPGSITIHAGAEFSHQYWHADDEIISKHLLAAAKPWIEGSILNQELFRWRYSKPMWIHPDPFLVGNHSPTIIFAGDAFEGPRVEGAALSGLAAANFLLNS